MYSILKLREKLDNNSISSDELFNKSVNLAKKYQDEYNSFVTIMENYEKIDSNTLISGIPYALKDNVSTKGILTTASSNILSNYVPVYDATIYKKLKEYINQHAKTVDIVCINTNGTPNRLRKRLLKVLKNEGIKR